MVVIRESLHESSVWCVGQVLPLYIDLSHHDTLGYELQLVVAVIS
jgi:hypothetical protein